MPSLEFLMYINLFTMLITFTLGLLIGIAATALHYQEKEHKRAIKEMNDVLRD